MFKYVIITFFIPILFLQSQMFITMSENQPNSNRVNVVINASDGSSCALPTVEHYFEVGTVVPIGICEPEEGFRFSHWASYPVNVEFEDERLKETTFIVPDAEFVIIRAIFESENQSNLNRVNVVINASAGASCSLPTVSHYFEVGTVVPIGICEPEEGYRFSHWASYPVNVEFEDERLKETTFIVPDAEFVIIRAIFESYKNVTNSVPNRVSSTSESCNRMQDLIIIGGLISAGLLPAGIIVFKFKRNQ